MFALIEAGVITSIVASVPPPPDPLPEGYVAPDYRPVVDGTKPTQTMGTSAIIPLAVDQWTIQPAQVVREFAEAFLSAGEISRREAVTKKQRIAEILYSSIAAEMGPDFTPVGVTSPLATQEDLAGISGGGLNEAAVDARIALLAATAAEGDLAASALQSFTESDPVASGALTTHAALSTTAHGGIVASNDARLTDARTPLAHAHAIADTTGLQTALDGKQASGSYAAATHTHAPIDITGTAVVTNDARLSDARTPVAHNQTASTITDFNATGDARWSLTSHTHAGTYQPLATVLTNTTAAFTTTQETKLAGIAAGAQVNADITKAEIEAKLTGVIASHSHSGGGSDPWTVVKLSADFTTSSATAVNVTGLSFTPAASTTYVLEGVLLFRTATATVGPRPGCSWPTGMTDGAIRIDVTSAAGTQVVANGNIAAAVLAPVGGLPTTTGSFPGFVFATLLAGAAPSGNFQIQLASETAGTNVTLKAGSHFRYRSI